MDKEIKYDNEYAKEVDYCVDNEYGDVVFHHGESCLGIMFEVIDKIVAISGKNNLIFKDDTDGAIYEIKRR